MANLKFNQYQEYDSIDIVLEIVAVIFGFLSVWFSKENKVLVFPTGMISTAIFVYLLMVRERRGERSPRAERHGGRSSRAERMRLPSTTDIDHLLSLVTGLRRPLSLAP